MKVFSTFAGVEGIGMGLPEEWERVGFSEIDKYASQVLAYHYPNVKNYGDITAIDWEQVPDFDLLTGGSPCQDFSIAGKRRGLAGNKSSLAWEYIRGLRSKKPRYFIWENVKGVMSSRGGWDFANLITAFSESGYALWWQVLNAKDFGVPQNRERIFVVGFREGSPKEVFFVKEPTESGDEQRRYELREQVANTLRTNYSNGKSNETYIQQLNQPKHSNNRVYGDEGISPTLNTMQGGNRQPKIMTVGPRERVLSDKGITRAVSTHQSQHPFILASRGRNPQNPKSRKSGLPTRQMLEPNLEGVSNTLTSVEKDNYVYDGQIRRLTPIECERLMSWSDNHTKFGSEGEISDSQRYKMCGNGVVSAVVKEIVRHVL